MYYVKYYKNDSVIEPSFKTVMHFLMKDIKQFSTTSLFDKWYNNLFRLIN